MEKVTQVYPLDGYKLKMQFNTGETRIFDAQPYLQKGVFQQLQDEKRFRQAYVALDTVCWPGGLDIAPETLYDRSTPE
ncbi:DUF2442 domain-containing protein [Desulfonatronum thioautotrophicum]|nr:DUF2442 domain-containing protein [Desulfonatronum thioautotrophicum]